MRILQLSQFYAPVVGGEERVVENMSRALADRGHDVSVATLSTSPATDRNGIRVHRLHSSAQRIKGLYREQDRPHAPPAPDPELMVGLRRLIAREQPDLVHAHNALVYSYVPLRKRGGPPLVLSLHDYGLVCATRRLFRQGSVCSGPSPLKCVRCSTQQYGRARGPIIAGAAALSNAALRGAVDLFLPVSATVADATGLSAGSKVRVLPNFVPAERHGEFESVNRRELPDEFILFVGDATTDKGMSVLLDAHARIRRRVPLVVLGRAYHDALAAQDDCIALGVVQHSEVLEIMRRSTIVVVPSLVAETFGMVALEAMALARPVVASHVGALPELIADGESGLLVPPGDAEALRRTLESLLAAPDMRESLGRAALARASAFSQDSVIPQLEASYRAVLADSCRVVASTRAQRA